MTELESKALSRIATEIDPAALLQMAQADEKKNNKTAYVITRSGEQFVASGYKKPAAGS